MSESPLSIFSRRSDFDASSTVSGQTLVNPEESLHIATKHVLIDEVSGVFQSMPDSGAGPDTINLPLRRSPPAPLWMRVFVYSLGILHGETWGAPPSIIVWRIIFVITETTFFISIMIASSLMKSPTHLEISQWKAYDRSALGVWFFSWIFVSLIFIYDLRAWMRPSSLSQNQLASSGFQSGVLTVCAIGWGTFGINFIDQSSNGRNSISKESSPLIWWTTCVFSVLMLIIGCGTIVFMALIIAVTYFKVWRNDYCRARGLSIPYPKARIPSQNDVNLNKLDEEIMHIPVAYYMKNSSWPRVNGRQITFVRQRLWLEEAKSYDYVLRACMDHSQARCHFCWQKYVAPEEEFCPEVSQNRNNSAHVPNHLELRCLPCKHVFHAWCVDQRLRDVAGKCPICSKSISFMFFADPEAILLN